MSNIKLDLAKFKHKKSDKDSTTLIHPQGHSITLAHKALSPEYRKQLESLPRSKMKVEDGKIPHFDKGGGVDAEGTVGASEEYKGATTGLKEGAQSDVPVDTSKSVDIKATKVSPHIHWDPQSPESSYAQGGPVNAYEAGLPCKNPNCKSQGKPHPNCKCYGGFAKGGKVQTACDAKSHHHPDCEYYAEGGEVDKDEDKQHKEEMQKKDIEKKENHDKFMENHRKMMMPKKYAEGTDEVKADDKIQTPQDDPGKVDTPSITISPDGTIQVPQQQPQAQATVPAQPNQNQAQQPQQPQAPVSAPQPLQQPMPAQTTSQAPMQAGMQIPIPPDIAQDPEAAKAYTDSFQQNKDEYARERVAFAQDIANGHITPKTYHDLYADKSTLGKVGTLFGLLIAGGGSGLTHQSNAVLDMMNNEIQRDLQAQEKSKENAINYLRVNQNDLMNRTQAKNIDVDTRVKSYALSQQQMLQTSFDSLVRKTNNMPEGPAKQQAQQVLGQIYAKMGDKINNVENLAAGASAYNKLLIGAPGASGNSDAALAGRINQLKLMGPEGQQRAADLEQKTISGVPSVVGQQSPRAVPQHIRDRITAMQTLDDKGKDLLNFIQQHQGINFNRWSPATRATAIQKVEEMKNFYNGSIEGGALTEGRLGWYDKQFGKDAVPTDILPQLLGQTDKFKEIIKSNANRRDILLKSAGFNPNQNQPQQSQQSNQSETLSKSGKPIVFRNGRWEYK